MNKAYLVVVKISGKTETFAFRKRSDRDDYLVTLKDNGIDYVFTPDKVDLGEGVLLEDS